MTKQQKYRIVCIYPGDTFTVQEKTSDGSWMEAHRCAAKGAEGLTQARKWIDERTEQ